MAETVIEKPIAVTSADVTTGDDARKTLFGELRAYALISAFVAAGWLVRDLRLTTPEQGTGYWLGIIGGVLMLSLLLYPLRKRIRFLHKLGSTRSWFRMHMILGLVGPLLVLYHCNFQLGSFNSRVALYCMLLVAGSGIVGRHIYAAIHKGLYGRKTNLSELQTELANSVNKSHGLAKLMPKLVARLDRLSAELQGDRVTRTLGIGRSLRWTFIHHVVRLSLLWTARRELQIAAITSETVARDRKRLYRATSRYIRDYTNLMGRVAQFTFYERLFALWHVLHLPIFYMMVLSALVHVLAVHMY
jgi:hypothetical protein